MQRIMALGAAIAAIASMPIDQRSGIASYIAP
jgi:hypothetical protein